MNDNDVRTNCEWNMKSIVHMRIHKLLLVIFIPCKPSRKQLIVKLFGNAVDHRYVSVTSTYIDIDPTTKIDDKSPNVIQHCSKISCVETHEKRHTLGHTHWLVGVNAVNGAKWRLFRGYEFRQIECEAKRLRRTVGRAG